MSEYGQVGAQAKKKGLHPLAWVAIGCGALLVIALVVVLAGGLFVAKKVSDVAGDFEENPALATARMIAAFNPDIEVVDADEETQTVTVRNTKTGEEITVDLEDLQEGRISFTSDEGEAVFGPEGVTVTGEEGTTVIGGTAVDTPSWVVLYPGATVESSYSTETEEGTQGGIGIRVQVSAKELLEYYQGELEAQGFQVETRTFAGAGGEGGVLIANSSDDRRNINVNVSADEDGCSAMVSYSEQN